MITERLKVVYYSLHDGRHQEINMYILLVFLKQDYTLSGGDAVITNVFSTKIKLQKKAVPTSVGSGNIILMLNKDNRIQVKPNE